MAFVNPIRRPTPLGSIIGFRINPSSAADYGASLVRQQQLQADLAAQRARDQLESLVKREVERQKTLPQGMMGGLPAQPTQPTPILSDARTAGLGELEVPEITWDGAASGSIQNLPQGDEWVGVASSPINRPPKDQVPSSIRGFHGDQDPIKRRYDQAQAAIEAYLAQLEYERSRLEAERDRALAEARSDIAAQYDEQIKQINEDIATLRGNLGDLRQRVPGYLSESGARWEQAVQAARGIVDAAGADFEDIRNEALKGIEAGYDSAVEGLTETLKTIGAGSEATLALQGVVRELEDLAYDTVEGQHDDITALNAAAEQVAIASARAAGITDEVEVKRFATQTEQELKKSIDNLVKRRTSLEEAKARALRKAEEAINQAFSESLAGLYQDQFTFAMGTVTTAMDAWFEDKGFDMFDRADIMATFEGFINDGVTSLEDFQNYMATIQEERNKILAAISEARSLGDNDAVATLQAALNELPTLDPEWAEAIETMFIIFDGAMLEWEQNQVDPNTLGFSGTGTKANNTDPNNIAAAKAGKGAYGARAKYVAEVGNYISNRWGVEVQGANYYRPTSATGPGRSSNSDHFTAGALDIMLNPNDPDDMAVGAQIMNYLRGLGTVAYTIWNPDDPKDAHWNHIHVSFKLGGGGSVSGGHSHDDGHNHGGSGGGGTGSGGGGKYF